MMCFPPLRRRRLVVRLFLIAFFLTAAVPRLNAEVEDSPLDPTHGDQNHIVAIELPDTSAAPLGDDANDVCLPLGVWRELPHQDLSVFVGLEGSKEPQDFGINAHFGGRSSVNWAFPISNSWGLGIQIGTALDATSNAVKVEDRIEGTSGQTQSFSTVGLFQRFDSGLLWGAAYDFLYQDTYDQFFLGQWRGKAGYLVTCADEMGVQTAIGDRGDSGRFGNVGVALSPLDQSSLYWKHTFPTMVECGGWAGIAEGHGRANVALGDLRPLGDQFVFGSEVFVPLTNCLAISGEANFIMPADTGTVDAYFGLEYRPWGGTFQAHSLRYAPMMPVADNTDFSVDLRRR